MISLFISIRLNPSKPSAIWNLGKSLSKANPTDVEELYLM